MDKKYIIERFFFITAISLLITNISYKILYSTKAIEIISE